MKKSALLSSLLLIVVSTFIMQITFGQNSNPTREERFKKLESKMIFPLIKGSTMCGVIPVEHISSKPDPNKEIKIMFDFTQTTSKDNQAKKINEGLEEVARVLNLHIAAGLKKEKLKVVIVFHSGSILSVLTNEYYQQTYKSDNPNIGMLNQLNAAGVEMVICGQSLALREISHNQLIPEILVAISAKTTLSKYAAEGYFNYSIKPD